MQHNQREGGSQSDENQLTEEKENMTVEIDEKDTNDDNSVISRLKILKKRNNTTAVLPLRTTRRMTVQKHNNSEKYNRKIIVMRRTL